MSTPTTPSNNTNAAISRKKKTTQRFQDQFGKELNNQDFGISQLQKKNPTNHVGSKKQISRPPEQLVATKETLEAFSDDVASLWCGFGAIPVLDEPPSALTFLRDFVSPSRPCIIRNALLVRDNHHSTPGDPFPFEMVKQQQNGNNNNNNNNDSSHFHPDQRQDNVRPLQFSLDDLVEMDPQLELVVDASPDGEADVVRTVIDHATGKHHRLFVTPEQRRMTLADFRKQLRQGRRQQQKQEREQQNGEEEVEDNDLAFEEELYDENGKRIFAFKNSKPPAKTKNPGDAFFENMASCTPTNMLSTPTSCNPFYDMEDLIVPCFMELLDSNASGRYHAKDATEEEQPPPPPPPPPPSVLYYSRQNDCFRTELPSLYAATKRAIPKSLAFAEEAFGTGPPEAINLWMGDERSVSSMHKDPYENLFYVASGEKLFTLCPPADAPYLYEQDFMSGQFDSIPPSRKLQKQATSTKPKKRQWCIKTGYEDGDSDDEDDNDDGILLNPHDDKEQYPKQGLSNDMEPVLPEPVRSEEDRPAYVRWIEADVAALRDPYHEAQQLRKFPLLRYAHPIHEIRIQAGEMLYLPALW